ncbi:hypothetical protein LIA77_07805 [Sarocladium implicatum]|nr:hypothetical protein LIA77_07805 [Sarocladium implicatum]
MASGDRTISTLPPKYAQTRQISSSSTRIGARECDSIITKHWHITYRPDQLIPRPAAPWGYPRFHAGKPLPSRITGAQHHQSRHIVLAYRDRADGTEGAVLRG